ncbi:MAG: hypothetical protein ACNYWU_13480 [Desulfobacterales bacterium]
MISEYNSISYVRKSSIGSSGQVEKGDIIAGCGGLLQNRTESFQKPVSIGIVFKNVLSLDTPAYDMMQGTWRLPAIASSGEAGGHLFRLDVACDFIATNK